MADTAGHAKTDSVSMKDRLRGLFRASSKKSTTKAALMIDNYKLGPTLGIGGYARVMLGVDSVTGEKVALKLLLADATGKISESKKKQTARAIELLSKVRHKNVLSLVSSSMDSIYPGNEGGTKCIMMALEHAPNGELFDYLMFTGHFSEEVSRAYFHQLVDGLEAIHVAGYAHRDLKPENLLLDKNYVLKIADFGFATSFQTEEGDTIKMKTACGTKGYLAPEVLRGDKYLQSVDIFAAGIILFIMYAGFPPFNDAIATDWWWARLEAGWKERALGTGKVVDRKGEWSKHGLFWAAHERSREFPINLKDFLVKMMHYDPEQRPSIDQIRTEKWSFYQNPPRVYGKKESAQKKKDIKFIKANTVRFEDSEGRTVVDGDSWFNGPMPTQEELSAYLMERQATVRREAAKKVAEQQRDLDATAARDVPTAGLEECGRSAREYFLAVGMEARKEKLDPEGKFDAFVEDFNSDALFSSTPFYFYTRMLPGFTMAAFQYAAEQLFPGGGDGASVMCNYEMVQMIVDTQYQPKVEVTVGDDALSDIPLMAVPCQYAVMVHRMPGTEEDPLYLVSCKRIGGDPMVFKKVMERTLSLNEIVQLRYVAESEISEPAAVKAAEMASAAAAAADDAKVDA